MLFRSPSMDDVEPDVDARPDDDGDGGDPDGADPDDEEDQSSLGDF